MRRRLAAAALTLLAAALLGIREARTVPDPAPGGRPAAFGPVGVRTAADGTAQQPVTPAPHCGWTAWLAALLHQRPCTGRR